MRYVAVVLAVLLVVAGLAALKGAQISVLVRAGKEAAQAGPPPETVATFVAKTEALENTLSAVGSVSAVKSVGISNDAPGVVSRIHFESGERVTEGQVLVDLDANVERAQLASARAKQDLAKISARRSLILAKTGSVPPSQLDNDEAALRSAVAESGALVAQITRKVVRAPFDGELGIRNVNLGQYVASGTVLTSLVSTKSMYVDFTLPQENLSELRIGTPVRASKSSGEGPPVLGEVAAVDPNVDPTTRTFRARATVQSEQATLRPGMFVNVTVLLPQKASFVIIPTTAVVHAAFGDSVFIVEQPEGQAPGPVKSVRQQFVRLGETRGDFVAVTDGVRPGQVVVTAGAFKLRNGSHVIVNNEVTVQPSLSPHPPNR